MKDETIKLFERRAIIRKKRRFLIKELSEQLDRKTQYKFKHLLRNSDKKLYRFIEDNFEYKYLDMMIKCDERIRDIDYEIDPTKSDVETMLYVEALSLDEELNEYFTSKGEKYMSNLDDKYLHFRVGGTVYNASLILDRSTNTDYVNLYPILFEYSWFRDNAELKNYLLSHLEQMNEYEYKANSISE